MNAEVVDEIAYVKVPIQDDMIVGLYFYNKDDTMVRAFTDIDFEGEVVCTGCWTAWLKPGTKDFQKLIDFAIEELQETDPESVETVGLLSFDD